MDKPRDRPWDKPRQRYPKLGEYALEGGSFGPPARTGCVTSGTRHDARGRASQCARTLRGTGLRVLRRMRLLTEQ